MKINSLTLKEGWDGKGFVVLSQAEGFNFSSRRFKQGILLSDFGFLFNDKNKLPKATIQKIIDIVEEEAKQTPPPKKDDSVINKS